MKSAVLFYLLFQFSSIYCVKVIKDVIYLPTSAASTKLPTITKKSASAAAISAPRAWITGDINKVGHRAISVCTWVKSLDQNGTGTIFAYVTKRNRVEFGLVGMNTKQTKAEGETTHSLYVVVKGKKSAPLNLAIDDVRWHHICVTWASRYGVWRLFKDGVMAYRGDKMKRRLVIARGGRYFIGGGVFKLSDDEGAVNASDVSDHSVQVSKAVGTVIGRVRKKRNVGSRQTTRMIGKFTDFYVWGKVLTKNQIAEMADCTTKHRIGFNEVVKTRFSAIFASKRRRGQLPFDWAGKRVIYAWDVATISLRRPATLKVSGNVCGYPISIECETNRMLLSMKQEIAASYNVQRYGIHLADHNCRPQKKGNFLVFNLPTMDTCGTKREVVGKEVHYTNYITNTPRADNIFVGQLFRSKVVCKFPTQIPTSVSSVTPGKGPEAIGKTPVRNPVTGKKSLVGVFALAEDDRFTDPLRQGGSFNSGKNFWGGIRIQGIDSDDESNNVSVVVDECWVENQRQRSPLITNQGCNGTGRVIGNGRKPNVRMEFSPKDMKQNSPTFIGCSFRPCALGEKCVPNCQDESLGSTAAAPIRRQRDTVNEEAYKITIGPFTPEETVPDDEKEDDLSDAFLLAIILPSALLFVSLIFAIVGLVYCCTKRTQVHQISKERRSRRRSDRGSTKSRHPIRAESFTFCRPGYSSYNIYPRSFHEAVRAKFQNNKMKGVAEETEQNTNTMISTVN